MWTRARSPPESWPTGWPSCSVRKRKRFAHDATCTRAVADRSPCRRRRRGRWRSDQRGSRPPRCCSKWTTRRSSAALDRARVGGERAGEELEERALAAAVGAEQAEAHARAQHEVELVERSSRPPQRPCRRRSRRSSRRVCRPDAVKAMPGLGGPAAVVDRRELVDQLARLGDARLLLGGARLGALAQPGDLAAHAIGERLADTRACSRSASSRRSRKSL